MSGTVKVNNMALPQTKSRISHTTFLMVAFISFCIGILLIYNVNILIFSGIDSRIAVFILAIFCTVILLLLIAELISIVWLKYRAGELDVFFCSLLPPDNISMKLTRHHYLGYTPTPGYREGKLFHNSLGFRGDEFSPKKQKGIYRIFCLGDSIAYGSSSNDNHDTFPYNLEKELLKKYKNIEVINAGVPGWSSYECLIDLQLRLIDLEPDLIIIHLGINEVNARMVEPSAYKSDNSGSRLPLPIFYVDGVLNHLTLVRVLRTKFGKRRPPFTVFSGIVNVTPTSYVNDFQIQKMQDIYPKNMFKKNSALSILEQNKPVYFERNIRSMIAVAAEYDCDVLLSSFAFSTLFEEEPRSASKEYVRGYRELNEVVKRIAKEKKTYFLDLCKLISQDREYWSDGRHLSAKGEKLKAGYVADYIGNSIL